jgi:putative Mn2+ efflux pump MntP
MVPITNIFVGLGLAADAFAVSVSSGIQIKYIKINKALKIALSFSIFQTLMPLIGWWVGLSFRDWISSVDHWVVFGLLNFIGGRMIYESTQEEAATKTLTR